MGLTTGCINPKSCHLLRARQNNVSDSYSIVGSLNKNQQLFLYPIIPAAKSMWTSLASSSTVTYVSQSFLLFLPLKLYHAANTQTLADPFSNVLWADTVSTMGPFVLTMHKLEGRQYPKAQITLVITSIHIYLNKSLWLKASGRNMTLTFLFCLKLMKHESCTVNYACKYGILNCLHTLKENTFVMIC